MKKILYISGRLPNTTNAGGLLYIDILQAHGLNSFSFVAVENTINPSLVPDDIKTRPIEEYSFCIPSTNLLFKLMKKIPFIETAYIIISYKKLRRKIINSIIKQDYDMIFAPFRGEVLLILPDIIKETKLPLYAMVEDTVEREIDGPRLIYLIKRKNYYSLLSKVKKLGVAGETMKEYFKKEHNIESVILRPSIKKYSECKHKAIDSSFNIFFAGNIYAKKELNSFLNALIYLSNHDKKITIYFATHQQINFKTDNIRIINLGWRKEIELYQYMNICHIAYLPYKSENKFMHSMKYAFPGKAGFYIANNLPIFFHGPSYSSFNTFLTKYQVGVSCDSMEKSIIIDHLKMFINNKKFYTLCQTECFNAFKAEFDYSIFEKKVASYFKN